MMRFSGPVIGSGAVLLLAQAVSVSAQPSATTFIDQIDPGEYACSPSLCETALRAEIWVSETDDRRYQWFASGGASGWVEEDRRLAPGQHEALVNWDDGSGKPKRETIRLELREEGGFLFTDSEGRRNLMLPIGEG